MRQAKKRQCRSFKRTVHIYDEPWRWKYGGRDVLILSPTGDIFRACRLALVGCPSWDILERAEWKGYGNDYAVTPSRVKAWVVEQGLEAAR